MKQINAARALPLLELALTVAAALCFAPPLRAANGVPTPDHVVVVIEENHAYSQVIGSSSAPYINNLAGQGALFTNSFAVEHPSEPNYLDLFSGSNQGVTDDSCPHTFSTANLGSELLTFGHTFMGYSEDMPSVGYTGCSINGYRRKHNPWVNFTNVPAADNQPYANFPTDFTQLPAVSIVVPNMCDDMHDCSVQTGDSWLQNHMDTYAQWAKTHNSLLIVTWDEDDATTVNHIATFFVGQMVKSGHYGETINHFNVLRTLEDMFSLPYAGRSATAAAITDCWGASSPPPPPTIPPAPTGLTATSGNGQVSLSWSASSGATSYNVKRSTVSGGPYATISSPTTTSYTNTGLTNGTTYYYVVSAVNSAGESANTSQASATPVAVTTIPTAPTGLAATPGNAQVSLSWSASSGATSYNVKRATVSGGPYTTIASSTSTSYTNTGLTNGTAYFYVVSAVNSAGESANSGQASATPTAGGTPRTLNATADAFVWAGTNASKNYGASAQLIVKRLANNSTSIYNRCSYLKFDLTGVTAAPTSAKLTLTVNSTSNPSSGHETVSVYWISGASWTESGITWSNAPGLNRTNFSSTGTLVTSQTVPLTPGAATFDLTSFVGAHLGQVVTLQLMDNAIDNLYLVFNSKEASSGRPALVITP